MKLLVKTMSTKHTGEGMMLQKHPIVSIVSKTLGGL